MKYKNNTANQVNSTINLLKKLICSCHKISKFDYVYTKTAMKHLHMYNIAIAKVTEVLELNMKQLENGLQ